LKKYFPVSKFESFARPQSFVTKEASLWISRNNQQDATLQ